MLSNGDYDAYSTSPNMDDIEGAEDAEIIALTFGLKQNLREANTRFQNGVYVHKIIGYLDPKFWLHRLTGVHYRENSTRNIIRDLLRVARLIENAGIELVLYWVPKGAEIRPHVIADRLLGEHQSRARVSSFPQQCAT
jgi:hypothetical protein